MMTLSFALRSDVGCVRPNNEDMVLLNGEFYRDEAFQTDFQMDEYARFAAIVADGMGGHEGGEFASELAAQAFDDFVQGLPDDMTSEQVIAAAKEWAEATHRMITAKGIEMPQYHGMGTTLTGLFSYQGMVFMINIGDSRLYRYRDTVLKQISEDHSLRNLIGTADSNVIYNSLGAGDSVFADVVDITARILPDDRYLVCSDGLTDMLSVDQMDAILDENINRPQGNKLLTSNQAIDQLVDAAKSAGGKDNISVILIHFQQ